MFLLDTDICSAYMRGRRRVFSKCIQHGGRLHISAITLGELHGWVDRSQAPLSRQEALIHLLGFVVVLPVDERVARKFGAIRANQLDSGRPTPQMDLMIASTAIVHGLTLVTHNTRDYADIPGLSLVDWMGP